MKRMARQFLVWWVAAAAVFPAHAGNVVAKVYQASSGYSQETPSSAPGLDAQAWAAIPTGGYGAGTSSATRLALSVQTHGLGTTNVGATSFGGRNVSADASGSTSYTLIDTTTGLALTDAQAAGITLAFAFHATGSLSVDPLWLSGGGVSFSATVYSAQTDTRYAGLSTVYGPVPPPPGYLFWDDYSDSGDATLRGVIDRQVTLLHSGSPTGTFEFSASVNSANGADAWLDWRLESVSLVLAGNLTGGAATGDAAGSALSGGLALQLAGSSDLIAVSAVPEPGRAWLALCGLALLAAAARRRRSARAGLGA